MIVSKSFPPNYVKIQQAFNPPDTVVFTYGNIIFAPHIDFALSEDLLAHEAVHMQQQGNSPAMWWDRYIADTEFRLQQELKAYRAQYKYYLSHSPRDKAFGFLHIIATDLSGLIYNNLISLEEAKKLITQK